MPCFFRFGHGEAVAARPRQFCRHGVVLSPGGVAFVAGKKTARPRPGNIDEWTHFLHGPDNNAVANDDVVGHPREVQWLSGPAWTRSHDKLASISAIVCTGGRIFDIIDEGETTLLHRRVNAR